MFMDLKDFESQLINNDNKAIKTWAIYWSQHIFLSNGLCLNPIKSLVNNVGAEVGPIKERQMHIKWKLIIHKF